ncbi:PerC family transcriptional regulator [Kosakonia cowanii]
MRKNVEQYNAKKLAHYHSTKVAVRQVQKCVAVTPAAKEMEQQALLREQAGLYRRASYFWLRCLDMAQTEVERARIAVRRDQCIARSNGLRRGDYSGIGARGVVYD